MHDTKMPILDIIHIVNSAQYVAMEELVKGHFDAANSVLNGMVDEVKIALEALK